MFLEDSVICGISQDMSIKHVNIAYTYIYI